MTKILIPTLRFPPAGGVGLRRIMKIGKKLAENGVEVHYVTTNNSKQINSYSDDIKHPNIKINKIPSLSFNSYLTKYKIGIFSKIISKIIYYITLPLFFVDYATLWGIVLIPYTYWYIKRENIKNIYVSGAAFSTLFHMAILKHWLFPYVNLICEWRDYWTDDYERQYLPPIKLNRKFQVWMERYTILHCDKVIGVTPTLLSSLVKDNNTDKYKIIENGFDKDDFYKGESGNIIKDSSCVTVCYTGNIVDTRAEGLFLFLDALNKYKRQNNIVFEICGELGYRIKKKLYTEYKDMIDSGMLVYHGLVSVREAIGIVEKSTLALVLVQRQHPEALTSKFFEYCYARKPIIAIGPKGDLQDKMNKIKLGIYCELDSFDSEKLNKYICEERKNMEYQFDEIVKHNDFSYLALKLKDELI